MKARAQHLLPWLVLTALSVAVSAPLHIRRLLTPTLDDYDAHVMFTLQMLARELPPTFVFAHPAYQAILGFLYWLTRTRIDIFLLSALLQVIFQVAAALILYGWIGALPGKWGQVKRIGISLALTLVTPIMLLAPLDGRFYFGYIGLANYHNPTIHMLRPFALLSFILLLRLLERPRSAPGWILLSAALNLAAAAVKPSWAVTALPAVALICVLLWIRKRPLDLRGLFWGFFLPNAAALIAQYALTYLLPHSDPSGIQFAPFAVEAAFSAWLPWKILLSVAFPLVLLPALLIWFYRQRGNQPFPTQAQIGWLLAWLVFLSGAAQLYLFAETGERMYHGNFRWSAQIGLFILFAWSARHLLRQPAEFSRASRCFAWGFFGLHLLAGLVYAAYCWIGPGYA